jgi:hypothetical protein
LSKSSDNFCCVLALKFGLTGVVVSIPSYPHSKW